MTTIINPLEVAEENYDWLELPANARIGDGPLSPLNWDQRPVESLVQVFSDPDYLHFAVKMLLNIDLLPFQMVILNTLWHKRLPLLIASRGAGKSFILAVYLMLRLIFEQGCKAVIVGAGFRQARIISEYMIKIWEESLILKDICHGQKDGPKREIDRVEFRVGKSVAVFCPLGDGCLSPNTKMTYKDHFGEMIEISGNKDRVENETWDHNIELWSNGKFRTTDKGLFNGRKPTKIIKNDLGMTVEATHNHKFKVLRGTDIHWVRTDEMRIGDYLLVDRSKRWHSAPEKINEKDAYNLGLTHEKAIPSKMMAASRGAMRAFLSGLFDTDGHVQVSAKKGGCGVTVGFTNTSEKLIDQIQYILLHYGILAEKIYRNRKEERKAVYELLITGNDVKIFADEINFGLERKRNQLNNGLSKETIVQTSGDSVPFVKEENVYYSQVTQITDGHCDTYDIHVPDGNEYCAGGFFSHNSKIRGLRANIVVADEISSVPIDIFNIVVQGFGIVAMDPVQKVKDSFTINRLKKIGAWSAELGEAQRNLAGGNQLLLSGTAFYHFNHFCKTWEKWKTIIESRGDARVLKDMFGDDSVIQDGFNWKDYAVVRIPFNALPPGFLDPTILSQAKATLTNSQFNMEYGAIFAKDSEGFFKRSILEACTTNKPIRTPSGIQAQFSTMRRGLKDRSYVIGIDPARSEDNAAIVVLEVHPDHRRIVYCWSINRKKFTAMKSRGLASSDDYYAYLTRKIRDLMKVFNTEAIVMDSQGGGGAVLESLGDKARCEEGELPIYEVVDEDKPKDSDMKDGLHILNIVNPSNDFNSEANHGMLKDFETRTLLFPMFDTIELARAIEVDKMNDTTFDSYEDLVDEIEAAKVEITTIVCTPTPTGKEHFDTPDNKVEGQARGTMRKDRYSAILYANKYCRDSVSKGVASIDYKAAGGTKETLKKETQATSQEMYHMIKPKLFKNSEWLKKSGVRFYKG